MFKNKNFGEFLLLLFLVVFGVACLVSESGADALTISTEGFTVSFYVNLISIILLCFVAIRLVFLIFEARKESDAEKAPEKVSREHAFVVGLTMAVAVFFVWGMKHIGFYVCTSVTLFVLYMTFEQWNKKELWKGAVFTVAVCLIFLIVFKYLKVFLPNAWLF